MGVRSVALLAMALAAAACGHKECLDIPPPLISVLIADAVTGGPVQNATVTLGGLMCRRIECSAAVPCEYFTCGEATSAGTFTLTATAPGYQKLEQSVTLIAGDCGDIVNNKLTIQMQPQ